MPGGEAGAVLAAARMGLSQRCVTRSCSHSGNGTWAVCPCSGRGRGSLPAPWQLPFAPCDGRWAASGERRGGVGVPVVMCRGVGCSPVCKGGWGHSVVPGTLCEWSAGTAPPALLTPCSRPSCPAWALCAGSFPGEASTGGWEFLGESRWLCGSRWFEFVHFSPCEKLLAKESTFFLLTGSSCLSFL